MITGFFGLGPLAALLKHGAAMSPYFNKLARFTKLATSYNESVGDRCAYCATNERDAVLFLRQSAVSIVSSLEDFAPDLDDA